jgi:hypothetical protein
VIETDEQRRWWFATHPEYSWSRRGDRTARSRHEDTASDKVAPEDVDAYVDNALKYADEDVANLLKSVKRHFGTEAESAESREKQESAKDEEANYRQGWNDGYWAIHRGKVPPDIDPEDKSAYARGVREGAATALDEQERWAQEWLDPLLTWFGTHPSRTLGRNLTKAGQPRPSPDYDAHHLVPWRHWMADPARKALEKWGIPLDGIENGMWLQRPFHRTLANNYRYMDTLNHLLSAAKSREEALATLNYIRSSLSRFKIPK